MKVIELPTMTVKELEDKFGEIIVRECFRKGMAKYYASIHDLGVRNGDTGQTFFNGHGDNPHAAAADYVNQLNGLILVTKDDAEHGPFKFTDVLQ